MSKWSQLGPPGKVPCGGCHPRAGPCLQPTLLGTPSCIYSQVSTRLPHWVLSMWAPGYVVDATFSPPSTPYRGPSVDLPCHFPTNFRLLLFLDPSHSGDFRNMCPCVWPSSINAYSNVSIHWTALQKSTALGKQGKDRGGPKEIKNPFLKYSPNPPAGGKFQSQD